MYIMVTIFKMLRTLIQLTILYCTVHLKGAKRLDLKISHHTKKF